MPLNELAVTIMEMARAKCRAHDANPSNKLSR
jgi:hypothetical protein